MRFLTTATLLLSVIYVHANKVSKRSIKDKFVVITGGAGDICSAIADKFLENGAKFVILADIKAEKGMRVAHRLNAKHGEGKVEFLRRDVTKDLERVVRSDVPKYGPADVLVNCAGVVDENNARRTLETNLLATIEWSDAMYELTRKDQGGKGSVIINVSDMYAYVVDYFLPIFSAGSSGIVTYGRKKGHESLYRNSNVGIISILPGFANTSMTRNQMEVDEHEKRFRKYSKGWPWQTPNDCANAVHQIYETGKSGEAYTVDAGEYFVSPHYQYHSEEYIASLVEEGSH